MTSCPWAQHATVFNCMAVRGPKPLFRRLGSPPSRYAAEPAVAAEDAQSKKAKKGGTRFAVQKAPPPLLAGAPARPAEPPGSWQDLLEGSNRLQPATW